MTEKIKAERICEWEDYSAYHGKEVRLLLDGRGYDPGNRSYSSNTSIELRATVLGESRKVLGLEDITCLNQPSLNGHFSRGAINKDYIIGIFEQDE